MRRILMALSIAALAGGTPALAGEHGGGHEGKNYKSGDWKGGGSNHHWRGHHWDGSGRWDHGHRRYWYHGRWLDYAEAALLLGIVSGTLYPPVPTGPNIIIVPAYPVEPPLK